MLVNSTPTTRFVRPALAIVLLVAGLVVLVERNFGSFFAEWPDPIVHALKDGLLCALGTALGALPVLFIQSVSRRTEDTMLGFGGGVMLAATVFSLLIPALDAAGSEGYGSWGASLLVTAGLLAGMLALLVYDRVLPGEAPAPSSGGTIDRGVLLFVTAIVLHNVPEGMAVGVSSGASLEGASGLALGIALQDVPEGMIVALVLLGAGLNRWKAVAIGALSGVVEPVFAVICALLVGLSQTLLPWGLAFAAGAMLFAVVREIIPRSQGNGHPTSANIGLGAGFCLMMVLDTALV